MSSDSGDINGAVAESAISRSTKWKARRSEIVCICQLIIIFSVIIACIVNLSISDDKAVFWCSLLSGCVGYILPSPKLKGRNDPLLPDATIKQQHGRLPGEHADALCYETTSADFVDGSMGSCARGDQHPEVVVPDSSR